MSGTLVKKKSPGGTRPWRCGRPGGGWVLGPLGRGAGAAGPEPSTALGWSQLV